MQDYSELVASLRHCAIDRNCQACEYDTTLHCVDHLKADAADAIEALQAEVERLQTPAPWHRVEDDPPDGKENAIIYFEWAGISGTVYRTTSIISLDNLIALGCRPIAWMKKPEPPKEDA